MRWRRRRHPDPTWRGVHDTFTSVPASGWHQSQSWLDALEHELGIARNGEVSDDFVLEHEVVLMVAKNGDRVTDFGGGLGASYAWVRRAAPALSLAWTVVELPEVVARGQSLATGAAFSTTIPSSADVVFVKSSLQYIDDWAGTLRALFAARPRHLVLEKFSGVASRTYATAQVNLADSVIPYWFISFDALFRIAADCGYRRTLWRRLPRVYDQSNFPPELRMGQASTIVFTKS